MQEHYLFAIFFSVILVFLTSFIFYEILSMTLSIITKRAFQSRLLMFLLVAAVFFAHTIAVWLYAGFYWIMVHQWGYLPLSGAVQDNFFDYIYFSAATYSSLGIGDVYPHGVMRFIAGVQVLNGLMLIGWSVTISYFAIQKKWDFYSGLNNIKK